MAKSATKSSRSTDEWSWLQSTNDKDRWSTTRIPDGDIHAPYIKRMSKNSNGTWSFYVYRNQKCIGAIVEKISDKGLELAKAKAKSGKPDPKIAADYDKLKAYVDGKTRDAALFKELSEVNQRTCADVFPWAMPTSRAMEAKGVKHVATTRTDLQGTREKQAAKSGKFNMDATIKRVKKEPNPKKAGSIQFARWEVVFAHDGKTVREFFAKGGDKYGIEGALEAGWVTLVEA